MSRQDAHTDLSAGDAGAIRDMLHRPDQTSGPTGQILPHEPRQPGLYGLFDLTGSVGEAGDNRRSDVIRAQILLGNAGFYPLAGLGAPTGFAGGELTRAIRGYQKARGLAVDGLILPRPAGGADDGGRGETMAALAGELGGRLAGYRAPSTAEVDRHYDGGWTGDGDGIVTMPPDGRPPKHPLGVVPPPAPLTAQATRPTAVPAHKTDVFARPENKGALDAFDAALNREFPDSVHLRGLFRRFYIEEGGRVPDASNGATGEITKRTLEDMYNKGQLPDIPRGSEPHNLTPAQQVRVLRANAEDMLRTVGGTKLLADFKDPEAAYAVLESLTWHGRHGGAMLLQQAINKSAEGLGEQPVVVEDGQIGPQTVNAFRSMLQQYGMRDLLLDTFAAVRRNGRVLESEKRRIDRTRPQRHSH